MNNTLSSSYPEKLRAIRLSEKLTQKQLSELIGVSLSTIKNYETKQFDVGLKVVHAVVSHPQLKKYALWLMTGECNPELGQISPTLSPDGSENTSKHQKAQKVG